MRNNEGKTENIERFRRGKNCRRLSTDSKNEVLILAHAPIELSRNLNALQEYCDLNAFKVNGNKTKIIFRKSKNLLVKNFCAFKFGEESIEAVDKYTYFGDSFDCTCNFESALEEFVSAANTATGSVLRIVNDKKDTWSTYSRLFESLVASVFLYGYQIWALDYIFDVEKIQISFLKKILHLPICTPGYAVRLETGRKPLSSIILNRAPDWIEKISKMDDTRFPKQC